MWPPSSPACISVPDMRWGRKNTLLFKNERHAPMICAEEGGMPQLDMCHSQKPTALPGFVFVVIGYAPGMR